MGRQRTGEAMTAVGKRFHSYRVAVTDAETAVFATGNLKVLGITGASVVNQGSDVCALDGSGAAFAVADCGRLKPGQVWSEAYDPNLVALGDRIRAKCATGESTTLDVFLTGEERIA